MEFCAKSDKGRARKINQDSFGYYTADTGTSFFIIADGMGGHNAGEVASAVAVNTFIEGAEDNGCWKHHEKVIAFIKSTFQKANDIILYKAASEPGFLGMGTTAVSAVIMERKLIIGNLGDSRAYLISARSIRQLTVDHSYVEILLKAGSIGAEEAKTHPRRNEITKALGIRNYSPPDLFEYEYQTGDLLILCSDGLNKMVEDAAILEIATGTAEPDAICSRLIDAANENGGLDNITVIAAIL